MQVRPLQDRVLVERLDEETKTAGGIIIPDTHTEKPAQGKIVSVGPGYRLNDGSVRALDVKEGIKSFSVSILVQRLKLKVMNTSL